jgi:hypothetical protein
VAGKSAGRLEWRVRGLTWKAMRVCRELDERAGCPGGFVNGLWAPLYEQEAGKVRPLPGGYEVRWDRSSEPAAAIYRNVGTGEEGAAHPDEEIEAMRRKAREAMAGNEHGWDEPRKFLDEIVKYLHEDHDYRDLDDDIAELDEEGGGDGEVKKEVHEDNLGAGVYDFS